MENISILLLAVALIALAVSVILLERRFSKVEHLSFGSYLTKEDLKNAIKLQNFYDGLFSRREDFKS